MKTNEIIKNWRNRIETTLAGKKGFNEARARLQKAIDRIKKNEEKPKKRMWNYEWQNAKKQKLGRYLALNSNLYFDEHGSSSGDYRNTTILDVVFPQDSIKPPYFDMGKRGLALISVARKRIYAKSWKYGPSYSSQKYLIGMNEAGTFFSHAVHRDCDSVKSALSWIWKGLEHRIVARQGDIALVNWTGPKLPSQLPSSHEIEGEFIVHPTHPPLPLPKKGERIIVGRRLTVKLISESRD